MNHYYYDRPDLAAGGSALPPGRGKGFRRRRRERKRRPGLGRAAACLCAFLVLMAGGSAGTLVLRQLTPFGAGGEWWTAPAEGETVSILPAPTETVERAPVGDGTTLTLLAEPEGEPLTRQAIYEKCLPSIVSIQSVSASATSQGTGIVMTGNGYIITNHHVIEGAQEISVTQLSGGETYEAKLVGSDAATDLAVLKVEARDLTAAEFGDSALLRVGDLALALGNPLGERFSGTMTDGIISFIDRSVLVDGYEMQLIQTSAALNSGNSGGALLNEYGQVVGVTTLKMSSDWNTIEALGFAVPTATVKGVVDQLLATGYVTGRPTIGITVTAVSDLPDALAQGLPMGVYVATVDQSSDAWAKGVRPGDVITAANGTAVYSTDGLNEIKNSLSVGDTLELELFREGETVTVSVELVEQHTIGG